MKYKVIGWTYCGDRMYPPHEYITASVDAAIIKEIRKHKYLFGGDAHEQNCPVLNDGTHVDYSWRGWGRIIALSYGIEGEYAYMCGYMDQLIKPKARKYPELDSLPKDHLIVAKESLVEVFEMHLDDDLFEKVKEGTKTVEIRLFDDKRKQVDIGDYIEFIKKSDECERVIRRVVDLYPWESFQKAFSCENVENGKFVKRLRFAPEQLGAPKDSDLKSLVKGMYRYYDKKQEKKYGVISFTLEQPKHSCSICFSIMLYSPESHGLLDEKLLDPNISNEEYEKYENAFFDDDSLEKFLSEISQNYVRRYESFVLADYHEYDVDVNVMLRKMLKDFFGKEQKLKEIMEKFCKVITLEIFATIIKDSKEPKQRLSLDEDIKEFLQKSGVKLKLKKKRI